MLPSRLGGCSIRYPRSEAQFKAKGFDYDQAEAITKAVRTGVTGGVATKADLAELRADQAALESRLTCRIIIVGLALNAAAIAAVGWMLS